jgi:hypothetical protein
LNVHTGLASFAQTAKSKLNYLFVLSNLK